MSDQTTSGDGQHLRSVFTSNMPELLSQLGISLAISTYQAGKVILIRADDGVINTHFRDFGKPMGIAATANGALSIGGRNTIWTYHNVPAVAQKLEPANKHDACYLPRRIHVTGDIDIHEMGYDANGELIVVNTKFGALCTIDPHHSFNPIWKPSFLTALTPEDRCHLNGLAFLDGRPRFVTALGETDTAGGWRENKKDGGILIDIPTQDVLLRGLSMPHSPRVYQNRLWVLESGQGSLALVDVDQRRWHTVSQLPGFTRGIDFIDRFAFIGLSQVRESAVFSGIPIVERVEDRHCGIWVVDLESGSTVGFLRFEAGVEEIFAVQILPHRFPEIMEWNDERMMSSYIVPEAVLPHVPQDLKGDVKA